jgi:clan AA aspartic protease
MGLTHVTATVSSFNSTESAIEAEFLVDTGAINCLLPASMLKRAGVRPERTEVYELAGGQLVEFPVGSARIDLMDTFVVVKVIFGPEDTEPLLGAVALESAGLIVDPSNQTLSRLRALSLKRAA